MNKRNLMIFIGFILFISILIIGMCLFGEVSAKTITVAKDGSGNYKKIQDGIDGADDWDTVFVKNGIYYENVVVDKTLTLIGNGIENTTIDGEGDDIVVEIKADYVKISNFLITGSGDVVDDSGINVNTYNNTLISNCKILNNKGYNIYFVHSNNNKIFRCNISNSKYGMELINSCNNTISNNNISDNYFGISFDKSCNNNISNNNISNNKWGIDLSYSSNNTIISSCNISNNNQRGIDLSESGNNTISSCNIFNNNYRGIDLWKLCNNNKISNCNIFNNCYDGIYFSYLCDNNIISSCNISNNTRMGIWLNNANNNIISSCFIFNNSDYGIYLYYSTNSTISNNTLINDGFSISGDILSHFIYFIENNIINGKPLLYYKNENNIKLNGLKMAQIILVNCNNFEIKNININNTDCGMKFAFCENNTISNCKITNNNFYGISFIESRNNTILNCNVSNNGEKGIAFYSSSNNNNITKCIISNNIEGIHFSSSINNTLSSCNISESTKGIYIFHYSNYNIISRCNLSNNIDGIYIYYNSNDNIIFHNTFIDNRQNRYDKCLNNWDDDSEGNYWDDYNGTDTNSDGIGDIPYKIGIGNSDYYPLMYPIDFIIPTAEFKYSPLNPSNLDIIYFIDTSNNFDGKIIIWNWSFGDGNESNEQNPTHKYPPGIYLVTLTITEEYGAKDNYSIEITVSDWTPPVIYHTPITTTVLENTSITILAKISSPQKIKNAYLFYRKSGTKDFIKVEFKLKGENYIAEIPAKEVTITGIEYYIFTTDGKNNATHPSENPENNPHKFNVNPDPAKNLPDLKISLKDITFSSLNPKEGDKITIYANISNIGKIDAKNIKISLFNGEELIETKTINEIKAGDYKNISFEFRGEKGTNKIRIIIDSENEIHELNETNNEAVKEITFQKGEEFSIVVFLLIGIVIILISLIFTINLWYPKKKEKKKLTK